MPRVVRAAYAWPASAATARVSPPASPTGKTLSPCSPQPFAHRDDRFSPGMCGQHTAVRAPRWTGLACAPASVCRRNFEAFWTMKSPQGATAAGARGTASFGARRSVARPCRSSVALPFPLLSALITTPRACSPDIEAVVSQAAGGQGPPHPPAVAALRGRSSGLLLGAVCRTTG